MTQSLKQLERQIEALQRQAARLRSQEVDGVVARIRDAITHYGLTAEQLGYGASALRAAGSTPAGKAAKGARATYANELGQTWGGMGPRPGWLRTAIESGKSVDDFLVGKAAAPSRPASGKAAGKKTGAAKKRRAKTQYRHPGTGQAWAGMGPQPRWLKELVASGRALEELAVRA